MTIFVQTLPAIPLVVSIVVLGMAKFIWIITHDIFVPMLLIAMALDTIVGSLYATDRNEWNKRAFIRGLGKKLSVLCAVFFCYIVQRLSDWELTIQPFRNPIGIGTAAAALYLLMEGLGIFRNLELMGVWTPRRWLVFLKELEKDSTPSSTRALSQEAIIDHLRNASKSGDIPVSNYSIDVIEDELSKPSTS